MSLVLLRVGFIVEGRSWHGPINANNSDTGHAGSCNLYLLFVCNHCESCMPVDTCRIDKDAATHRRAVRPVWHSSLATFEMRLVFQRKQTQYLAESVKACLCKCRLYRLCTSVWGTGQRSGEAFTSIAMVSCFAQPVCIC